MNVCGCPHNCENNSYCPYKGGKQYDRINTKNTKKETSSSMEEKEERFMLREKETVKGRAR